MSDQFTADSFQDLSIDELVSLFNEQVGVQGWTSSRAQYLDALYKAIESHPIDHSQIIEAHHGFRIVSREKHIEVNPMTHALQWVDE